MAPPKRKRPHDEDEAAQVGKMRRATRQTSIPPPPLPVPPQEVPRRRALRGHAGAEASGNGDAAADTKTRQGTVRTRRASGVNETRSKNLDKEGGDDDDEAEVNEKEEESENEEQGSDGEMSPRTKRRLARQSLDKKEDELAPTEKSQKPVQSGRRTVRPAKNGRAAASGRPTTTTRGTRRTTKDAEIADSEADEAVEDDEDMEGEEEREEEDTEDELSGPATVIPPRIKAAAASAASAAVPPPTTRRLGRSSAAQPTVTPVSPPKIPTVTEIVPPSPPGPSTVSTTVPKKETNIKPPAPPSPVAAPAAGTLRPKKVTEIKPPAAPPAPRYPKATPIQPPPVPVSPTRTVPAQAQPPPQPAVQAQPQKPKAVQLLLDEAAPSPRQQQQHAPKILKQTVVTTAASSAAKAATTTTTPRSATTPTSATSLTATSTVPPASPSQPDRNIDKVVLGEICFKAWYPSYYGKEVLGDTAGNSHHGRGGNQAKGAGKENHNHHHNHHAPSHHYQQHAHGHGGKDKDATPMLDRLYVCPFCFKYSKEIVPWHGHVQVCESQFQIPGEKVYVHPKGVRTIRVPVSSGSAASTPKGGKRRRVSSEADIHYVEQVVKDEGEWSIWEVDGEKDVLFCQNLSLFAKLFLDSKSVFFGVSGFYYFLLVYTPPPSLPSSLRAAANATASPMGGANANGQASILGAAPRPRVVGFFSKEKMSWDNNNLACILVFPPWQRKGLGALLMGISYEISRREGIMGGPEKPISDLGKKGYKRFWGAEIARWLLSVDITTATSSLSFTSSSSAGPPSSAVQPTAIPPPNIPPPYSAVQASSSPAVAKGREARTEHDSLVIDVADCSQATWIVRDDCLYVLREMGIVEDAGMGPPKKYCDNVLAQPDEHVSFSAEDGVSGTTGIGATSSSFTGATAGPSSATASSSAQTLPASASAAAGALAVSGAASGSTSTGAGASAAAAVAGIDPPREVQRVRISKAAVRQWVKDNHINLEKPCDPAGFIKIYVNKDEAQQAAEEA